MVTDRQAPHHPPMRRANLHQMSDEVSAIELGRAKIARPVEPVAHAGERASAQARARPHLRLLHGMRRPANWLQLVRFGVVGATGFVVNVGVYAASVHALSIDYRVSFVLAWMVAVTNNFLLNRHWTFDAGDGIAHHQAMRFFVVSVVAAACSFLLLTLLVEGLGLPKVPAEALAVAASTPLNFLGNKLWSFSPPAQDASPADA